MNWDYLVGGILAVLCTWWLVSWWYDSGRDWWRTRKGEERSYREPDHPTLQIPNSPWDWALQDTEDAAAYRQELHELDRLRRLESRDKDADRERTETRVQRARGFTPVPITDEERRKRAT